MEKKYFDTKKGSVEEKINTIASEQPTINATYTPDVKLTTEKKYFETKPGSLADAASKIVSEALDPVNKDAVKKKFDDRKDKDIDNDGDTDSTDKYLHKRRKAISKAVKSEEVGFKRYHETKQGSLRDAVLQMWGEGLKKDEKKDLTKEKKDDTKKMTDTGKEVTPVETSVKMPKIKETKNKV